MRVLIAMCAWGEVGRKRSWVQQLLPISHLGSECIQRGTGGLRLAAISTARSLGVYSSLLPAEPVLFDDVPDLVQEKLDILDLLAASTGSGDGRGRKERKEGQEGRREGCEGLRKERVGKRRRVASI